MAGGRWREEGKTFNQVPSPVDVSSLPYKRWYTAGRNSPLPDKRTGRKRKGGRRERRERREKRKQISTLGDN